MKFVSLLLSSVFTGLVLSSCDRIPLPQEDPNRNFLVGTWVVDREKTLDALKESMVGDKVEGIAGQIAAVAIQKSAEKMMKPLDNVKYTFTETEYSDKIGSYAAQMKSYEIIARPSANVIKTKDDRGIVNEYHLEDQNIWYFPRGQKIKIYLRASN